MEITQNRAQEIITLYEKLHGKKLISYRELPRIYKEHKDQHGNRQLRQKGLKQFRNELSFISIPNHRISLICNTGSFHRF